MATKLYSFRIHRNRPVFEALDRAAHWLCMEYIGGAMWTITTHGIRGLLAMERRTLRYDGSWRKYLHNAAGWLWEDFKTIPALLSARIIGARGMVYLMRGALNARTLTDEAIIPAMTAIERTEERIYPAIAALHAQWEAEREAREAEKLAAYEAQRATLPPSLDRLMFDMWFAIETDDQRERFLLSATELLPFVRFPVENFHCQVYHAAGDHASLLSYLCDGMTADERRDMIDGWRERGLGYLADYYTPLVAERLGLTASNTMSKVE